MVHAHKISVLLYNNIITVYTYTHTGPGSSKSATEEGMAESPEDLGEEPDDKDEGAGGGGEKGSRQGSKPQLRVYIPGQKEFVPRTVSH